MVLVFNPYGTALPASAATAGGERVEVAEYRAFVRRATGACCAIVVLPRVADADIDRLSRFSLAYPELPLRVDDALRAALPEDHAPRLRSFGAATGLRTLRGDGARLVRAGITAPGEVLQVTR